MRPRPRRTLARIVLRGWRGGIRIGPLPTDIKPGDSIRIDGKNSWRVQQVNRLKGGMAEHEVVCEPEADRLPECTGLGE